MPATQRGQVDRIKPGHWRLRYRINGTRHSKQPFASKSKAWDWYRQHVEATVNGEPTASGLSLKEVVVGGMMNHARSNPSSEGHRASTRSARDVVPLPGRGVP